jgi:hypothetical protein
MRRIHYNFLHDTEKQRPATQAGMGSHAAHVNQSTRNKTEFSDMYSHQNGQIQVLSAALAERKSAGEPVKSIAWMERQGNPGPDWQQETEVPYNSNLTSILCGAGVRSTDAPRRVDADRD